MDAPRWKFSVGPYQGWLVGSQSWEVRDKRTGETLATAQNMSDCCRKAERLHEAEAKALSWDSDMLNAERRFGC